MFRVVLVDDEHWALKGIYNSFDWEKNGFEVIAKTTDPDEALDIILEEEPDVVFTDIRMPEISGIELIRLTREAGIVSEFVIVSGFKEFEWAQQALKYDVSYYLLKPIDLDEAETLQEKLLDQLKKKRNTEVQLSSVVTITNYIRQHGGIENLFKMKGFLPRYGMYQVIASTGLSARKLEDLMNMADMPTLIFKIALRKYLCIVNGNEDISRFLTSSFSKKGIKKGRIGVSRLFKDLGQIINMSREADIALHNDFIYGHNGVYIYHGVNHLLVKSALDHIVAPRKNRQDILERKEFIEKLPGYFIANHLGMEALTFFYNGVINYIFYGSYNLNSDIGFGCEYMDYERIYSEFGNFQRLSEHLNKVFCGYSKEIGADGVFYINSNFKKLLAYIQQNYFEKLSLDQLSRRFFLNPTYICDLFKKVTGGTFSSYMTHLRLAKSCELLKGTDMTIAQVAAGVGYENYYYFNKVFKEHYGITPSKFRKG